MSFIILFRNPSSNAVFVVTGSADGEAHEFSTEQDAEDFGQNAIWGAAWPWEVINCSV
jgi:hypothetical protein